MRQHVSAMAICFGVILLFTSTASALQCYECAGSVDWNECQSRAIKVNCGFSRQVSILGQDIILPAQSRQLELACLSLSAESTSGSFTAYAYIRQCAYNDKSICSIAEAQLPVGYRVTTCDLCTNDLCNGANSVTIAFSTVLLMVIAVMLRQ